MQDHPTPKTKGCFTLKNGPLKGKWRKPATPKLSNQNPFLGSRCEVFVGFFLTPQWPLPRFFFFPRQGPWRLVTWSCWNVCQSHWPNYWIMRSTRRRLGVPRGVETNGWNLVVSNILYFHPCLGKISNFTNIFQMGWNHQLVWNLDVLLFFWLTRWDGESMHKAVRSAANRGDDLSLLEICWRRPAICSGHLKRRVFTAPHFRCYTFFFE